MMARTPVWQAVEFELEAAAAFEQPLQECELRFRFESPSGRVRRGYGFWDGGRTWRIRFAPDEPGVWHGLTLASRTDDRGLHGVRLEVTAIAPTEGTRFERHGPIRVADSGRHFAHLDGTPFLWFADTAWNGPLLSTEADWQHYLEVRTGQGIDAVQWVATHWLASVEGDREGRMPYSGRERIIIDPAFFARLDARHDAIGAAGLLSVPVMLWAAEWRHGPGANEVNPGFDLPEDQAILLARYMVARWDADPVAWLLPGDGPYTGDRAARWRRIGQAVFDDVDPRCRVGHGSSSAGSPSSTRRWPSPCGTCRFGVSQPWSQRASTTRC